MADNSAVAANVSKMCIFVERGSESLLQDPTSPVKGFVIDYIVWRLAWSHFKWYRINAKILDSGDLIL